MGNGTGSGKEESISSVWGLSLFGGPLNDFFGGP